MFSPEIKRFCTLQNLIEEKAEDVGESPSSASEKGGSDSSLRNTRRSGLSQLSFLNLIGGLVTLKRENTGKELNK